MGGFLDSYGVSDARRERRRNRILWVAIAAIVVFGGAYFFFRDFREKRQISRFVELLAAKQYDEAYRLWGCDPANPCRDYGKEKFLEDWGQNSPHREISKLKVRRTRSCSQGIIQILQYPPDDEVLLYVRRDNLQLSYSPWPYCVDAGGRNVNFLDRFLP